MTGESKADPHRSDDHAGGTLSRRNERRASGGEGSDIPRIQVQQARSPIRPQPSVTTATLRCAGNQESKQARQTRLRLDRNDIGAEAEKTGRPISDMRANVEGQFLTADKAPVEGVQLRRAFWCVIGAKRPPDRPGV